MRAISLALGFALLVLSLMLGGCQIESPPKYWPQTLDVRISEPARANANTPITVDFSVDKTLGPVEVRLEASGPVTVTGARQWQIEPQTAPGIVPHFTLTSTVVFTGAGTAILFAEMHPLNPRIAEWDAAGSAIVLITAAGEIVFPTPTATPDIYPGRDDAVPPISPLATPVWSAPETTHGAGDPTPGPAPISPVQDPR